MFPALDLQIAVVQRPASRIGDAIGRHADIPKGNLLRTQAIVGNSDVKVACVIDRDRSVMVVSFNLNDLCARLRLLNAQAWSWRARIRLVGVLGEIFA